MLQENPTRFRTRAHVIDDINLTIRLFRRGTRQLGQLCRLTIALNGEERVQLEEDAGDRAPRELVADIRTQTPDAETLIRALETRPWAAPDGPLIMFADPGEPTGAGQQIGYLVRTVEIEEIIETIRTALDQAPPMQHFGPGAQAREARLDAAAAGG